MGIRELERRKEKNGKGEVEDVTKFMAVKGIIYIGEPNICRKVRMFYTEE